MKIHTLDTGLFKLDGGAMFGVVPKSMWQKTNPADDNNMCTWAMRCLLIEDGKQLILVDTGMGNKQSEKFFSRYDLHGEGSLQKSIQALGFGLEDITDVFLTHLHFDHVGGAVSLVNEKLQPTFSNATYWSNASHWQWATQPNAREKASFLSENILPLQESGRLKFIPEEQNIAFNDHIQVHFAYGHTQAMMLPKIQYQGKTHVFMADLLPSLGHIPLPYVMGYDMFPMKTLTEKEAFFNEAVAENYTLILQHDAIHECCTLQNTDKGIRLKETFSLS